MIETLARYMTFQIEHAELPLVNLGVGANPPNLCGPGVFHVDLDRWNYPNFIQADIHQLPFRDDSFASVVCGDVLEHLKDPPRALREMWRVAPKIVLTTFMEWRLPGPGQYIEDARRIFSPWEGGYEPYREAGTFLAVYPESKLPHITHINQWRDLDELFEMFRDAGLRTTVWEADSPGVHEGHSLLNYMFVLVRR